MCKLAFMAPIYSCEYNLFCRFGLLFWVLIPKLHVTWGHLISCIAVIVQFQLESHTAGLDVPSSATRCKVYQNLICIDIYFIRSKHKELLQSPNRGLNWRHFHTFLDEDNMKWLKCSSSQFISSNQVHAPAFNF